MLHYHIFNIHHNMMFSSTTIDSLRQAAACGASAGEGAGVVGGVAAEAATAGAASEAVLKLRHGICMMVTCIYIYTYYMYIKIIMSIIYI